MRFLNPRSLEQCIVYYFSMQTKTCVFCKIEEIFTFLIDGENNHVCVQCLLNIVNSAVLHDEEDRRH